MTFRGDVLKYDIQSEYLSELLRLVVTITFTKDNFNQFGDYDVPFYER